MSSDLDRELLFQGLEDYVGLWAVASTIRDRHPASSPETVRLEAISILGRLVGQHYMEPGRLAPDGGFSPWGIPAMDAIARNDQEWRALGRDPHLDEICWFNSTAAGDDVARRG